MRRLVVISLLLLIPSVLLAAPPRLIIPDEVRPNGQYVDFVPDTDAVSVTYVGLSGVDSFPSNRLSDHRAFLLSVYGLAQGQYKFSAIASSKDGEQARKDFTVLIGTSPLPPTPPGPIPPGPIPPTPPPPSPPVPFQGKMVLIVYETEEAAKIPEKQQQILYGKATREYLDSKCSQEPGRNTKAWRIYDKDLDVSGELAAWKAAMGRPRTSIPWLIISNGVTGFEGPLPGTVEEAMTLFKKYLE